MRQEVPALAISPRCRAGRKPELTSEDLPLPEVPTTARKRVRASLSTIVSAWPFTAEEQMLFVLPKWPQTGKWIQPNHAVVLFIGSRAL